MTLTYEPDLDRMKISHRVTYLGQRLFYLISIVQTHIETHTVDWLQYLDHKVVGNNQAHLETTVNWCACVRARVDNMATC